MPDQENQKEIKTMRIDDVHILEVGEWEASTGKVNITDKTLENIVDNFEKGIVDPVLKLRHGNSLSEKVKNTLNVVALGYVDKLVKKGKSVFASFKQVPEQVGRLIMSGLMKNRSPEFYREYRRGGKVYDDVLTAVSFLGKEIPAQILEDVTKDFSGVFAEMEDEEPIILLERNPNMEKVDLTKSEYDTLVANKIELEKSTKEMVELKSDIEAKEIQISELSAKLETNEQEVKELKSAVSEYEKSQTELQDKMDCEFVDDLIKNKKCLQGKFRDTYLTMMSKMRDDEDGLKAYKLELSSRAKLGDFEDVAGASPEADTETKDWTKATKFSLQMSDKDKDLACEQISLSRGISYKDAAEFIIEHTEEGV